ncbi:CRISPR system Cascade subunit CasB [Kytococcus aerolatus]|uniref:CRISPR system Cascade subunit CasB n=1 Tax=Kytococcus aerolatus TaxID=592308 RepID=A0A212U5Z0_9MICO|nr:type I-E CRISPR-associated protein Cse2/CasB [Kytococcus aerolatus]SNC73491.1 CRISPR system Cascade subunit CasB [Kytococcus aerolatus]
MLTADQRRDLHDALAHRIHSLQNGYLADSPAAKGQLAAVRRGGRDVESWGLVAEVVPPGLQGRDDEPNPVETAVSLALQFYALHQQGRTAPMHASGVDLGRGLRSLVATQLVSEAGVHRRLGAVLTATDLTEAAHHLRGLVTQLRADQIPIDHARLGVDLVLLQDPRTAPGVRLRWVRSLRTPDSTTSPHTDQADASAENQEG